MDSIAKQLNIKEMSDWYKIGTNVTKFYIRFPTIRILLYMAAFHFLTNTMDPLFNYSPKYIQSTNGYHGNSQLVHTIFGKTRKIKENSSIGREIN
jgi:hypothetical protein